MTPGPWTVERVRALCLARAGSRETFPFDLRTPVFKVGGKMFALLSLDDEPLRVNLKCDPELAELLRGEYGAVRPGWHMNRRHWNTVVLDGTLPEGLVERMVDDSYRLVVAKLPRTAQAALEAGAPEV